MCASIFNSHQNDSHFVNNGEKKELQIMCMVLLRHIYIDDGLAWPILF